ncbi:MAG: hypothetical protein IPJ01_02510 [Micavibrio sp.]|nr:hypothetical protein [Micavibrio sp.]MBK9561539.1 hypothetical protein [Micavibrio sp.]
MYQSLAQNILNTAHAMNKNRADFFRGRAKSIFQSPAAQINPEVALMFAAQVMPLYQDITDISSHLSSSMRFALDHRVGAAVAKMDRTPTETLLGAYKFAKLPFPKTWIEYSTPGDMERFGWLLEAVPGGISLKNVGSISNLNHLPMYMKGKNHYLISEEGFKFFNPLNGPVEFVHVAENTRNSMCRIVMSVLLLLNSRSNIIQPMEPEENYSRLNIKRRKNGQPDILSMHDIQFDVSRLLKESPGISEKEASESMAAALVRGHFKVRRTGVFFWSPYVRGASSPEQKQKIMDARLQNDERTILKYGECALPNTSALEFNPPS